MNNLDDIKNLEQIIETAFERRETINTQTTGDIRKAVETAMARLDSGVIRISQKNENGEWITNQWLKKAVLLSFKLNKIKLQSGGPENGFWWDKASSKFENWTKKDFERSGFRVSPGAIVRYSAYVGPQTILMPSFINLGAYVDEGTTVDTWATVGSCAQIGKHVHLSGGAGIGGVLEPMQAQPTIIEDHCFIGARSEIVEGCIIREGSVIGMGVYIGKSTRIINRNTGEVLYGEVPPYSVVVPGSIAGKELPNGKPSPNLYCAVIIKQVDEKTRSKTSINSLLRAD